MVRLPERWRRRATSDSPAVANGQRVYCVGDIHGRLDLLLELQARIVSDAQGFGGRACLVYLGDYIDRGGQSREVLGHLIDHALPGFDAVHLRGNHEQAMLDFMLFPEAAAAWLEFGGRETLASYDLRLPGAPTLSELTETAQSLRQILPSTHLAFLERTELSWRNGDYYFVHAGIRPGVALSAQHPEDQMWIREDFTESTRDHGVVVVHGHTIRPEPEFLPNRIGLDTGAFHTGVLTCLVLEGTQQRLLQTGRDAS